MFVYLDLFNCQQRKQLKVAADLKANLLLNMALRLLQNLW